MHSSFFFWLWPVLYMCQSNQRLFNSFSTDNGTHFNYWVYDDFVMATWVICSFGTVNINVVLEGLPSPLTTEPKVTNCPVTDIDKFCHKVTHPLLIWAFETFNGKLWPNGYWLEITQYTVLFDVVLQKVDGQVANRGTSDPRQFGIKIFRTYNLVPNQCQSVLSPKCLGCDEQHRTVY